jgi:hypothetical protein
MVKMTPRQKGLGDYHHAQAEKIMEIKLRLTSQRYVKSFLDVYPDIARTFSEKEEIGYVRGHVPIKLMLLIYDKVVVYIPPHSCKLIEQRFQVTFDELIQLCELNLLIPIIGDVKDYIGEHFKKLFSLPTPPSSLWARGLALLDVFGMQNALEIARENLPIAKIASDREILAKWKKRFRRAPDTRIKEMIYDDLAVLYADLCVFGCEDLAKKIAENDNTREIYMQLQMANEIISYPIFFGMSAQPNFDPAKLGNKVGIAGINHNFKNVPLKITNDYNLLATKIGIDDVNSIPINEIINYQGDRLGENLRQALAYFNSCCNDSLIQASIDESDILTRAESFQEKFKDALASLTPAKFRKLKDMEGRIEGCFKIGAIAILAVFLRGSNDSILNTTGGLASIIALLFPQKIVDRITSHLISTTETKFVANIWQAKKIVRDSA